LFGKLAIRGAAEIHLRIQKTVAAVAAFAGGIIFEKFNRFGAFGAIGFKDGAWHPVLCILTRTFHFRSSWGFICPLCLQYALQCGETL
jgi:hypothetical protein